MTGDGRNICGLLLGRGTEGEQAARTRRWLRTIAEGSDWSRRGTEGEGSSALSSLLRRQSRGRLLLLHAYVKNKLAQPSASLRSGGSDQRQSVPQADPGVSQPRPIRL